MKVDNNLKEKYDTQYGEDLEEWRILGGRGKANNIIDISSELDFKTVIDIGSGDGSVLYWLDKKGFCDHIKSVEISESGIAAIQSKGLKSIKEIKLFDGYEIPYSTDEFDLALCSHVIEHVEYPRRLIREIMRVSKYQIFEIPIDFSKYVDTQVEHFLSYGHINIYAPQTFRFLLKSEGLEVLSFKNLLYEKAVYQHIYREQKWYKKIKMYISTALRRHIKFLGNRRPNVTIVLTKKTGRSLQIMNQ